MATRRELRKTNSSSGTESARRSQLMQYLQELPDADKPHGHPGTPKFHTGKLPNSKVGDGKPRLLLMGQRRYDIISEYVHHDADTFKGAASHQYQVSYSTSSHQAT